MIRTLRGDLVAGLDLYNEDDEYLGVSMGPPFGDHIEIYADDGADGQVLKVEWRDVRIGGRLKADP